MLLNQKVFISIGKTLYLSVLFQVYICMKVEMIHRPIITHNTYSTKLHRVISNINLQRTSLYIVYYHGFYDKVLLSTTVKCRLPDRKLELISVCECSLLDGKVSIYYITIMGSWF